MRHKRPDRINVVFKFYHFYDIKIDGRRVTDVKAQLICELPSFNCYYDTAKLVEICKRENLPVYDSNNEYAVIMYKEGRPVSVEATLYYKEDGSDPESFLDFAEWDKRVVASVALGIDLMQRKIQSKKRRITMDGQDTRKFQIEAKIESHFHLFQERTICS